MISLFNEIADNFCLNNSHNDNNIINCENCENESENENLTSNNHLDEINYQTNTNDNEDYKSDKNSNSSPVLNFEKDIELKPIDNSTNKNLYINKLKSHIFHVDNKLNKTHLLIKVCSSLLNTRLPHSLSIKNFSQKQTKELISELIANKQIQNNKIIENANEQLTMEQFVFKYFNYKFGLSQIVVEQIYSFYKKLISISTLDPIASTFLLVRLKDSAKPS